MKYLNLVLAGLWRKRVRTVLTGLSILAAFVLFGVLHSVTASLGAVVDQMSDSRLRTMNSLSVLEPMPLSYARQIETIPGVRNVSWYSIFFGYYQDPQNGVNVGAIDVPSLDVSFDEYIISDDAKEAMRTRRDAALVGDQLAEEYGWKVGDRIPLTSQRWSQQDGSHDWSFEVVGIVSTREDISLPANEVWINYDYFDEARTEGNGTVNIYFELIDDPANATRISSALDGLFLNSPSPTETRTEKEVIQSQIDQIGNIGFLMNAIIGAVLFTLVFVIGNTMMQGVRERIPELAVLKTCGFSDTGIVALVWSEALILCGLAGGIGLLIAKFSFPSLFATIGAPALPMPGYVLAEGAVLAIVLAFVGSFVPAWRVRRMSLVDALAAH